MYIKEFEVRSYKSYGESTPVKFKPGFNIITGQNSAGKTALLEALTMRFDSHPHRSEKTVPAPGGNPIEPSFARATFTVSREELRFLFGNQKRLIPRPALNSIVEGFGNFDGSDPRTQEFADWLMSHEVFNLKFNITKAIGGGETWQVDNPNVGLYDAESPGGNGNQWFIQVGFDPSGRFTGVEVGQADQANSGWLTLARQLTATIYRFNAERFSLGQCPFGHNAILTSNAGNLPEVMNCLQANTQKFLQLVSHVHEIMPQVHHVSVRPLQANQLEILVWPLEAETTRIDLAVPLNQCGSGIGQVLAILYVVMESHFPQTIIVDEPQSFLHPGAIRKLIEILKLYPQHQYIFATHSPTVITASDPATLIVMKQFRGETTLTSIDINNRNDLRTYLAEIGARLQDVFGADDVLWVEGQTEELCFPKILRQLTEKKSLMGTAILGIRQVGDLSSKDAEKVFSLYQRLSDSGSLLPPVLSFILDRECLTEAQKRELNTRSGGKTKFLARRMYENYLLDAQAISSTVNEIADFNPIPITPEQVTTFLDGKRTNPSYFCSNIVTAAENWIDGIDGARVLRELFAHFSENRESFSKTKHSVAITETLLKTNPEALREIAELLTAIIDGKQANTSQTAAAVVTAAVAPATS